MIEKSPKDTVSEELNDPKELEELLSNLPQILKELEKEIVPKETTEKCR